MTTPIEPVRAPAHQESLTRKMLATRFQKANSASLASASQWSAGELFDSAQRAAATRDQNLSHPKVQSV